MVKSNPVRIHAMKAAAAAILLLAGGMAVSSAESWEKELEFSSAVEESLGHYRAFELNLGEGNTDLAAVHATHPAVELYPVMSPHLQAEPEFSERLRLALLEVPKTAAPGTAPEDARAAIDGATALLEEARLLVVGDELAPDESFRLALAADLLGTAEGEYRWAVSDGEITDTVEFQDSSAFIWRSQQILAGLDLPAGDLERVEGLYGEIQKIYDSRGDPDLAAPKFGALTGILESNMDRGTADRGSMKVLPPLKQLKTGVDPAHVQCMEGLELLLSPSGRPACITAGTAPLLLEAGWTG